jgi:ribosomal protein S24E
MEIKKQIRNELFNREEISLVVTGEKNPEFTELKKQLASKFKKSEDIIEVYNIKGKFGRNTFLIKAYIYDSDKDLEKAKQKSRKVLNEERKAIVDAKKAEAEAKKKSKEEASPASEDASN